MNTEKKDSVEIKNDSEMTFETALARLEEIVRALEGGTTQLDVSLQIFEEGVGLVKLCNRRLDDAEQRIKILYKTKEGTYDEQDFCGKTE